MLRTLLVPAILGTSLKLVRRRGCPFLSRNPTAMRTRSLCRLLRRCSRARSGRLRSNE